MVFRFHEIGPKPEPVHQGVEKNMIADQPPTL